MKEFGTALFAFIIVATLAIGIPLIFFVDIDTTPRIAEALYIADQQAILLYNISYDFNQTTAMFVDLIRLDEIILSEELEVLNISNWLDILDCIGVKTINGNSASPNPERNFTFYGDGGINIATNAFNTVYINATTLKTQYDNEIQSISTLFDMTIATQIAITVLDAEVVKSINYVLPNANTSSVNVEGECSTQIYNLYNGTIAIDMCAISDNATAAFDGIQYEFDSINVIISDLLSETNTLVNETEVVYNNALALNSSAIFTINHVESTFNNINLVAGTGISITNGSLAEEIVIGNTGLIGLNGLSTATNNNIAAGYGISIANGINSLTVTNVFYTEPCRATVTSLSLYAINFQLTGAVWQIMTQNWGVQVDEPASCSGGTIFQRVDYLGNPFGLFYMPTGMWTLVVDMILFFQDGQNIQWNIALISAYYEIPFNAISYQQFLPLSSYYYGYYHFELTLSDRFIPPGTQFVVSFQNMLSLPTQSFAYFTSMSAVRVA